MQDKIWLKQNNETDLAYSCFKNFLAMPKPRSLKTLGDKLAKPVHVLKKWYKNNSWKKRSFAYDENVCQITTADEHSSIKEMYKRHIEKAIELQNLAIQKFREIDPTTLTNSEMIRFLSAGASLEQSARKAFEQASGPKAHHERENYLNQLQKFLEE